MRFRLPCTGAGSGLKRAMETGIDVKLNNNDKTNEFVVTILRKEQLDIVNFCSIHRTVFSIIRIMLQLILKETYHAHFVSQHFFSFTQKKLYLYV